MPPTGRIADPSHFINQMQNIANRNPIAVETNFSALVSSERFRNNRADNDNGSLAFDWTITAIGNKQVPERRRILVAFFTDNQSNLGFVAGSA
jgi:hypothetical protein